MTSAAGVGVVAAGETVAPRAGGVCFDFLVLLMAIIRISQQRKILQIRILQQSAERIV